MNIVAIVAHPDDEAIGLGGSIKKHVDKGDKVAVCFITCSSPERKSEADSVAKILGYEPVFLGFKDTEVKDTHDLIREIEVVVNVFQPQRVYIHYPGDSHQDHRYSSKASISACRNIQQILMFESPFTFTSFQPNFYIDISKYIAIKINALSCYRSQLKKPYLKSDVIHKLNGFYGNKIGIKYAEAFRVFKWVD